MDVAAGEGGRYEVYKDPLDPGVIEPKHSLEV